MTVPISTSPGRGGYRSLREGLRELAYDIQEMLALGEVAMAGTKT
jgi:hypothetical protein